MNKLQQEQLIMEARRIGDKLLSDAKTDTMGMYWETLNMDLNRVTSFHVTESIYGGVSGIVLFFLELFKQSQEQRYLDAAREGTQWLDHYCQKNSPQFCSFITGRMGVPYVMIRMHEARTLTGQDQWLAKALDIARACRDFLIAPAGVDDLIGGTSGTLLSLLHLHAASDEAWLLEIIDGLIGQLVRRANHGPKGLYWDRSENAISGLCGFSHGASGLGFTFLELGHYFQNEAFYRVAEQAFLYERGYYSEEMKNWPDLRKGMFTDEDKKRFEKAYHEENREFFTSKANMNAWCHGAAGIGLSRLRAFQLLNKEIYEKEARMAAETTIATDIDTNASAPSFILCHGVGGNADTFLYAYQRLNDPRYLTAARTAAQKSIEWYRQNQFYYSGFRMDNSKIEDRSLFMGNAGIGYFYLRVLDPFRVPSVLVMPVDKTMASASECAKYPFINSCIAELQKELLRNDFGRTLAVVEASMPEQTQAFFDGRTYDMTDALPLSEAFVAFVNDILPSPENEPREALSEIFRLESEKRSMDQSMFSHVYVGVKEKVLAREGRDILEKTGDLSALLQLTLQLNPDTRLAMTRWNWNLSDPSTWKENVRKKYEENQDEWLALLIPTPLGITEIELSPFAYTILVEFQEPNQVDTVTRAVIAAFEELSPDEETMVKEKASEQIRRLVERGILIQP
ncbi:MAG: lanthionine synthetase LanC family protein [Candidatus Omnitrophota bacterium]